jgi:hypothetical protein
MAAVEYELYLDIHKKTLSLAETFAFPFQFPDQKSGDGINFKIGLVEQDAVTGRGRTSRLTIAGLTCKATVGTRTAGSLTSVTMTVTNNFFVGLLPLNVAAISSLFSGAPELRSEQKIEFEVNDATSVYSAEFPFVITTEIATTALTDTAAPDTAIGRLEIASLYVPYGAGVAGETKIRKSASGLLMAQYLGDDGQLHLEPLT